MSSRVLRKLGLQGEKDITSLGDDASDTEDFSSSGGAKKKQLNINRYDLLNQQSHSESEVKEDDDNETAGSLNAQDQASENKDTAIRKKKKKKRKRPVKIPTNARSSEDNVEDEVERSVREVNELLGDDIGPAVIQQTSTSSSGSVKKSVLSIEHRSLNPNNELKRIFGSKIVQNEQSKRRGGSRNRSHLKTTWLVSAKENWPQIGKPGLCMSLVKTENGISTFTYEHSTSYQQVQIKFLDAVESLNPDNIVALINAHPYHVDALLQLSELCRLSEDLPMAAELIERALYCLEYTFHASFSLATGNCRLDYRRQENRALFITVFKHLMFVGSRACYRTALEYCKLLLSLDPDGDPIGVLLTVDFYALRAQKYEWLLRLYKEWEPTRNLSQLPNFAFSVAVANFQLGLDSSCLLQDALIMFPSVLFRLLHKCGVQSDSRVSSHDYFSTAEHNEPASLAVLVQLYIARCFHLWKESELLPWLESNVHVVLDRVDRKDPYVAECAAKRAKRYPSLPRNIQRHILLSDMKDVTINEISQSPVLSFDPLPPLDSVNLYDRPSRLRFFDNANAFSMFFRSLIPNFNMNQPALPEDIEVEGDIDVEGAGVDLRSSVTSLLESLRDLLSNIHMPDVPAEGDTDSDESMH